MKLVIMFVHVIVCVALILIVLLQKGKGASMGAAFGGSSQTVFGSTGATSFMHKVTVAAAIIFMLNEYHDTPGASYCLGDIVYSQDNSIRIMTVWTSFK